MAALGGSGRLMSQRLGEGARREGVTDPPAKAERAAHLFPAAPQAAPVLSSQRVQKQEKRQQPKPGAQHSWRSGKGLGQGHCQRLGLGFLEGRSGWSEPSEASDQKHHRINSAFPSLQLTAVPTCVRTTGFHCLPSNYPERLHCAFSTFIRKVQLVKGSRFM